MTTRTILNRVKRATVALAFVPKKPPDNPRKAPFFIIGTGFCIHPRGVIATCEHVITASIKGDVRELIDRVPDEDKKRELWPIRNVRSANLHALFFETRISKQHLVVLPAIMELAVAKMDCDVGLIRVAQHPAFKDGYPYLEIEEYTNVYEGLDIATCGFPLGNFLQEQLGTLTSSFTRGILSSIIPSPNAALEYVDGFQLDLTATFGNSGGPVFNWATGKVFGILQGGLRDTNSEILPGIARAEPVYKITDSDSIQEAITMSVDDFREALG